MARGRGCLGAEAVRERRAETVVVGRVSRGARSDRVLAGSPEPAAVCEDRDGLDARAPSAVRRVRKDPPSYLLPPAPVFCQNLSMSSDVDEVFAVRYAHHDRQSPEDFLFGKR